MGSASTAPISHTLPKEGQETLNNRLFPFLARKDSHLNLIECQSPGKSPMDPESIQLYLQEALKDSPSFRVCLDRAAQDAEDLEDWIESLLKGLKTVVDGQKCKILLMSLYRCQPNSHSWKAKLHSQGLLLETLHSSKDVGLVGMFHIFYK